MKTTTEILQSQANNTFEQDLDAKFDAVNKFENGTENDQKLIGDLTRCFKNPRAAKSIILLREIQEKGLKFDCDAVGGHVDPVAFNQTQRIKKSLLGLNQQNLSQWMI